MSESQSHKQAKRRAAGPRGRTETPLPGKRRLDALTGGGAKATEIERSPSASRLKKAVQRLDSAPAKRRELKVPQQNLERAKDIAKLVAKKPITISNIGGTQRRFVR